MTDDEAQKAGVVFKFQKGEQVTLRSVLHTVETRGVDGYWTSTYGLRRCSDQLRLFNGVLEDNIKKVKDTGR